MENSNKHLVLKVLLAILSLSTIIYTYFTIQVDGVNFFSSALEHLTSLEWKGQFTLDFSSYLLLSGLWVMWRNRFTAASILLGIMAMTFGIIFFAPYFIFLLNKENGHLNKVLLGERMMEN